MKKHQKAAKILTALYAYLGRSGSVQARSLGDPNG